MKKGIVFLITIILVFSLVIIGISKTNNQSQSEEKIKIIAIDLYKNKKIVYKNYFKKSSN